jgi:hypothetical protein
MQQIQKFLKTPYYFQWLIVFFVLHGYSDFIGFIRFSSLVVLFLQYSIIAWLLFLLCRKMYRDGHKAALLVTTLFFSYLFFGVLQDIFSKQKALFSFSYFRLLFPLVIGICVVIGVGLRIYKKPPIRMAPFLNLLLLIYIIFDVIVIIQRSAAIIKTALPAPVATLTPVADTVQKPDVYLLLLDEYQGTVGLQEYFHYSNAGFESFLRQKGFYVCSKPVSNYSFTAYSIPSLLNMRYLTQADWGTTRADNYKGLVQLINNNKVSACFRQLNYNIRNLSPFMVWGHERATTFGLLPGDIELITDRTAAKRIEDRLLIGDPPASQVSLFFLSNWLYKNIDANHEKILQQALSTAGKDSPTFTYIHLLMPHKPYIYDSTGRMAGSFDMGKYKSNDARNDALYLQYLAYTNQRISRFLEQLFQATKGKAVVMVMSDHGYRDAHGKGTYPLRFKSLNAVYLPNRDYHLWYDSVSNVNQFALLFNTLFKQQIPLLKDSSGY